jgi:hypothetical protein
MKYSDPLFTTLAGFGVSTVAPAPTPVAASKSATSDGSATNYLDGGDAATMRITALDTFILGGWVNVTDQAPTGVFLTKGSVSDTTLEYGLFLTTSSNVPYINVQMHTGLSDDSADATITSNEGDFSYATKTFLLVWFTGTQLKLQINAATPLVTAAAMLSSPMAGGKVTMFSDQDGAAFGLGGIMDEWFFCKNPASLANALTVINSSIYNSGTGVRYGGVSSGDKTTMGLVSWWGLDEASGSTRLDLYGSNNLTLHGTVTQTPPLVS